MKIFGLIRQFWLSIEQRKAVEKPKSFDEYVIKDILSNNEFGISEVVGLRSIKSMYFEREKYASIASLIKGGYLADVIKIPEGVRNPTFQEYLEIMEFRSQSGSDYIVTVYDSIELWQYPQVIEIFPIR